MKLKFLFLLMAAALVMGFAACSEEDEDDDIIKPWPAMKADKQELHFSIDGGCDTLQLLNYSSWWLINVIEVVDNRRTDHFTSHYIDGANEMEGDWFSVRVPKDAPNLLIVQCELNANRESRELFLDVAHGDASGLFHVMQDRVPRQ